MFVATYSPRLSGAYAAAQWVLEALEPRIFLSVTPATAPIDVVAQADNAFAFDLYHELGQNSTGNVFFSPYSVATALQMTLQGAGGVTASEMIQALHLPAGDIAQAGIAALYQLFSADPATSGYTLSTANRLWVRDNFPLLESFINSSQNLFGAAPQAVDFSNPDAAAKTINDWVSAQTHGKITNLIPPAEINPALTSLILTNAIYFKGAWADAFDPALTRQATFHVSATQSSTVEMMSQDSSFGYYAQSGPNGFQALDMPYQGNNLDMLVILPAASNLAGLQAELTPSLFNQITSNLTYTKVYVNFPQFQLAETYNLNSPLQDLGIRTAFTNGADFGISPDAQKISFVIHKSFISVDETGTEAAGATGIGMVGTSVVVLPTPPVIFCADHPFLFAIRDRATNTILFLGSINDPTVETTGQAADPTTPPPGDTTPPAFAAVPPKAGFTFVATVLPSNVIATLQSSSDLLGTSQGSLFA